MKRHLIYLFNFLLFAFWGGTISAQEGLFFGGPTEDIANSIYLYENNYYLLGTTRKSDKSATDYYVLRLNSNGSVKDEFVFGGEHRDDGQHILVNDKGIFVFGKTWDGGFPNNDMLLTKLDFSGKEIRKKYYGGSHNDLGHKFIFTKDDGFALVGFNRSVSDFGDVYLVKADKDGEMIWENHFGDRFVDHGFDVIENDAGELIVAGTKGGFFNPTSTDFLNHDADIYLIKTDSQGQEIWQKTYGGTGHDWAKKIIKVPGGGYFVAGSTQSDGAGSFDFFLMKIGEDGNEEWFKTYGGLDYDYCETVQLSADNHLYLFGTSASYSQNFKPDHFLVKTDLDGNLIWLSTYGGEDSDYGTGLVCTPDSGCAFTGWTMNGELGKKDIVLYKILKNGDTGIVSAIPPLNDSINQIQVFPNPVKKKLSVIIDTKIDTEFDFLLFDIRGTLVYQHKVEPQILNTLQLNFSSGLYFYSIQSNTRKIFSGKLVFQ